jgi:hypothetical protein
VVAERKEEKAPAANPRLHKRGQATQERHAGQPANAKQLLAIANTLGNGRKDVSGELPAVLLDLEKFTKLPLTLFFKILKNFLKNLKFSKYKSCSTFQILQLSQ